MTSPMRVACMEKVAPDRSTSEWLGAEARVYFPSRTLNRNRLALSERRFQVVVLMASFLSGLILGGGFALFFRDRKGARRRHVRDSEQSEPFKVSTEVTPCLDLLVA